jgi:hypothetical protein
MSLVYKSTPVTFHSDSDADDEYERGSGASPTLGLPAEYETSSASSDAPSAQNTPTTYSHSRDPGSPRGTITDWSADQAADFVAELGFEQYADVFIGS